MDEAKRAPRSPSERGKGVKRRWSRKRCFLCGSRGCADAACRKPPVSPPARQAR